MKTKMYAVLGLTYMICVICAFYFFSRVDSHNNLTTFNGVIRYNNVEIYPVVDDTFTVTVITTQKNTKHHLSKYEQRELKCLAKNMYYEAGGEGHSGWLAVGMVTMNRVVSGKYPRNICEVVYQNNGKVYQFSWAGTKKALTKPTNDLYNQIEELALHIYIHYHVLHDITGGALFFHAKHVKPYWSNRLTKTVRIGNHIFYTL